MEKEAVEQVFNEILAKSFEKTWLPLGFRWRAEGGFLRRTEQFMHWLRIGLSYPADGKPATFMFGLGIFSAECWRLFRPEAPVPDFPKSSEWTFYQIGINEFFRFVAVTGYVIDEETDIDAMARHMDFLAYHCFLPYFDSVNTIDDVLQRMAYPGSKRPSLMRMRLLTKLGRMEDARLELSRLLQSRKQRPFREGVIKTARADGLYPPAD